MLLLLSHLCGVRLMLSLFLSSFLFFYFLSSSSFMFYIVFLLCCYLLFVFVYSFFSNTIKPRKIFKNCDKNFHYKCVLIVKDYGKLGILYDEKLGGFISKKVHPFLWGWTVYWLKNRNLKSAREQFYIEKWFWDFLIH